MGKSRGFKSNADFGDSLEPVSLRNSHHQSQAGETEWTVYRESFQEGEAAVSQSARPKGTGLLTN